MNNGLPGPSTTDTITGGKTIELSEYDKCRKSHNIIFDGSKIKISTRTLSTELCCPICLDLLTCTMTTKECLHRFCSECITTALMRGNKECPTCRKKIVSKRSLRPDPNFDALINKIWPDRKQYEKMQEAAIKRFQEQSNVKALQKSIEDGMKAQAANRRMRIQGSYDYEKRKRRPPKFDSNFIISNDEASTSLLNESIDEGIETLNTALTNTELEKIKIQNEVESSEASDVGAFSDSSNSLETYETCSLLEYSNKPLNSQSPDETANISNVFLKKSINDTAKLPSSYYKLNKWLNDTQRCSPPFNEENVDDGAVTSKQNDYNLNEMRCKGEEIEVEFLPAKSLFKRVNQEKINVPTSLLKSHFLKALPDTTMEHIAEYLSNSSYPNSPNMHNEEQLEKINEKICSDNLKFAEILNNNDNNKKNEVFIYRPEYFYIMDNNKQLRKVFLHETLYSAFSASLINDNHLQVFFDVLPPDVNNCKKLVNEIISDDFLKNNSFITSHSIE